MKSPRIVHLFLLLIGSYAFTKANSEATPLELRFDGRQFLPATLFVRPGQPVSLKVINTSSRAIEFESFALNREKVIEAGKSLVFNLSPLKAGEYDFCDDFDASVPEGKIVVKEPVDPKRS